MQTTARLPNIMFSAILFCHGRLAQRLAQVLYTHKAGGSNPSSPTTDTEGLPPLAGRLFVISRLLFREPGPPSLRAPQRAPRRPRHRARLVAMVASLPHRRAAASASPPRRPAVTPASPPRRPAVTPASLPPCRHVSSARFRQSSFFLQNRGIFVQITEQRRKMRTPLLGNCVASR